MSKILYRAAPRHRRNYTSWIALAIAGSSILAVPSPAMAQDVVEDIIVTARRVDEKLQRTPVAVTAMSNAALERAQINTSEDLQRAAPNLTISTGRGTGGYAFVALRGQTSIAGGSISNDLAVGVYIDGIYIARPSQSLLSLVDIERVEVLRGPQGTLFGRNTTGGAINVITNAPKDRFEGSIEVSGGNHARRDVTALLNAPLTPGIAIRAVYRHSQHDGFARFELLDRDAANQNEELGRIQVRIAPADDWELTIGADYVNRHDKGTPVMLTAVNPISPIVALGLNLSPSLTNDGSRFYSDFSVLPTAGIPFLPANNLENYGFTGNLRVDLGSIHIKAITGYRDQTSDSKTDLDGTSFRIIEFNTTLLSKQFSQELQISGESGNLRWIGGAYYFRETGNERTLAQTLGFRNAPVFLNNGDAINRSLGLFGQAYYDITESFRLSAGLRYTWDNRKVVLHNLSNVADPVNSCLANPRDMPGGPCNQTLKTSFDYPAFTFGLDYQAAQDIFLYAKTSGATMAGGFNLRVGSTPAYRPETLRDIEAGAKIDWLDRRLRTNFAIFHSWQKGVHRVVARIDGTTTTSFLRNAGDARVYGAEVDVEAVPWEGMRVNGSLGLLRGHYVNGTYLAEQVIAGQTYTVDRSDEPLPQLPKLSFNLGATQTIPTSFGSVEFHGDYAYIGRQSFYSDTPAAAQPAAVKTAYGTATALGRAKGYGLLNASIAASLTDPGLRLTAWVRNLTDKKYVTRAYPDLYLSLGTAVRYVGQPRTWGLSLKYDFGS